MPIRCVARWTSGIRRSGLAGMRFEWNYAFSTGLRQEHQASELVQFSSSRLPVQHLIFPCAEPRFWKGRGICALCRPCCQVAGGEDDCLYAPVHEIAFIMRETS